jgi:hypothetical protein
MTDFVTPEGWKFHGSNNGNQTIFTLPGHTVAAPKIAIFDRVVPGISRGVVTHPKFRIRVTSGELDANGQPYEVKNIVDLTIRWRLGSSPSIATGLLTNLAAMLSDANLRQDIVEEQLLPR